MARTLSFLVALALSSSVACAATPQLEGKQLEGKPRLTTACVVSIGETDDPRCSDKQIDAARPGRCRTDSRAWARVSVAPEGCGDPAAARWSVDPADGTAYINGWHRVVDGRPASDCGTDAWGGTQWCQAVGWLAAPAGHHVVCATLAAGQGVQVCTVLTTYGAPLAPEGGQ